ncbi:HNH endonuclease signature motif containing protein, partial [Agrococcus baldri]|uniref:HNH endonuclease signature motif containing protein n=1 Tax=Agrococcus baldri TaxID=153730 RepID=UPI0011BFE09D
QQEQAAVAVGAARSMLERVGSLSSAGNAEIAELLAGTAELGRIVGALQVGLAGLVEERSAAAAEASFCRWLGHRDAKEAVASAFGIRVRDARALLSMAAATMPTVSLTGGEIAVKYPRVGAALTEGGISLAQARAIVGTLEPAAPRADLEQLAWAEGALVDAATDPAGPLVPELLVTQARAYVAVLDPDGVLPNAERQRAMRSARMRELPDGMWELTMLCTPESAAVIKALLDAYTGPRVKVAFRDDDPDPADPGPADPDGVGPDAVDPDAGREVDANGQPSAEGIGVVDDRTPEQQRHDVLLGLVQAHAASGDAPVAGGEPPTLVITGTIDAYTAYLRDVPTPDRTLTIEHTGGLLPIESIGRYACDGIIRRAILDCNGHVLELGTTERRFNRAQRRALAARDKGCRVPGCRMPVAWTEAHHITPWAAGGPTDIDNGILVCSYHHHEIHAGRLRVEAAST